MSDERTYKMLLSDIAGGGSGGGLPDYSEANDGDVLSIENGEPAWATPSGGLPDYSEANDGDVLTIDNGEPAWGAGVKTAIISFDAENFDSATKTFCWITYAYYNTIRNRYEFCSDNWDTDYQKSFEVFGYDKPLTHKTWPLIVPDDENVGLFLIPAGNLAISATGGFDSDPVTIYYDQNSVKVGYRITGNCSLLLAPEVQ